MDQYLHYVGGSAGALAITGVAAASAYYFASRPTPEKPLVPLDHQSRLLPVSISAHIYHFQNNAPIYITKYILQYTVEPNQIIKYV